jgi:hypothetical protein
MKLHNNHKTSDIARKRRSHNSHPDERCMYYLGNSHQQYDLWETNLYAFRNLHWGLIRLCYPTVVKIQTDVA